MVAGGASITFSPIHVKSFDSISISGYWTNLVDTRFSSLRAEIRVRLEGNWLTVAYNDHVRGGYGSVSPFYAADFEIIPNDLSAGSVDGLMIAPDSVIFSGLGGLNSEGGTSFAFTAGSVPEPESYALVLCALGLMGAISRRSKTKPD